MATRETTRAMARAYLEEIQTSCKKESKVYEMVALVLDELTIKQPKAQPITRTMMAFQDPRVQELIGDQQFADRKATARGPALITAAIEDNMRAVRDIQRIQIQQNDRIIEQNDRITKLLEMIIAK